VWKLVLSSQRSEVRDRESEERTDLRPPTSDPLNATRLIHKTIHAVTQDIEQFHFNKGIARIRELTNALEGLPEDSAVRREGCEVVLQLLNPYLPHVTEELWERLGHAAPLTATPWPKADAALIVDDEVTVAVQVGGKLRATIQLPKDMDAKLVEARVLELEPIRAALAEKQVAKIIVVPNRIVNVVVK
jgi:leucyl-tRNA synthetase